MCNNVSVSVLSLGFGAVAARALNFEKRVCGVKQENADSVIYTSASVVCVGVGGV